MAAQNMNTLWRHVQVATFADVGYGWQEDICLLCSDGKISFIGKLGDLPGHTHIDQEHDGQGACITPTLIDCHTHLVYAGNRALEFELRLEGASYADIARAGGGIRATVAATRAASEAELLALAVPRAAALMREGVARIEIKSGYGLSLESERACLRVARQLGKQLGIAVHTTYLAAHALPAEFAGRSDDYIESVNAWMRVCHDEGLIDAVDVFCEGIGFTPAQTESVFAQAKLLGLPVKLHAEQLSDQGGAALAARYQALSCDHLEYLSEAGVTAMAAAGTVAVLLPAAYYFLRETKLPPIELLRRAGVPMALATDHNPGSSPMLSPLLAMNMACTFFRLTPLEAWQGFTVHAARALGLSAASATLRVGGAADFVLWSAAHPRELIYPFGHRPVTSLVLNGQIKT
ncbi:MAG: Imidazolonepropionase [Pseudomonadota bacterium]|jgi:imidazolonepropionase